MEVIYKKVSSQGRRMAVMPEGVPRECVRFKTPQSSRKNGVTNEDKILAIFTMNSDSFQRAFLKLHPDTLSKHSVSVWYSRSSYMKDIDWNATRDAMESVKFPKITTKSSELFPLVRFGKHPVVEPVVQTKITTPTPDVETLLTKILNQNERAISILEDVLKVERASNELFQKLSASGNKTEKTTAQ